MSLQASIIIVVKNDRGIDETLAAIQKQDASIKFETLVIDASEPSVLQDIKVKYPNVNWHQYNQNGKRFTITEQRNVGIKLAKGKVIVFIDANCLPTPMWLESMLQAITDGEKIVTGPCRPSNDKNLVHYIQEHEARTYVQECTTINVAVDREIFQKIGQFDETLTYGEDVDFFWRATDAGFKICHDPDAVITHDYGSTEEQFIRAYRYGKSRAALHKKHWRTRWYQLLRYEPHVWIYPLFILSLSLAIIWPAYLLVLLIPIVKNRSLTVIVHHLTFACGVLVGTFSNSNVQ